MLNVLVNSIMKYEKEPELSPIRVTKDGFIECMSKMLFGKFKFKHCIDGKETEFKFSKDFYLNYKSFINLLYPILNDNPKIQVKENALNVLTKYTNLKINLLLPFDDFTKNLDIASKKANKLFLDKKYNHTKEITEEFIEALILLRTKMTIAKSLSTHKDLDFIKISDGKLISFSPISVMGIKDIINHEINCDIPGFLTDLIIYTTPLELQIRDDFFVVIYPDKEGYSICGRLQYEEVDYKQYTNDKSLCSGKFDISTTNKFWKIAQTIESMYWVRNLRIVGSEPFGTGLLKFKI